MQGIITVLPCEVNKEVPCPGETIEAREVVENIKARRQRPPVIPVVNNIIMMITFEVVEERAEAAVEDRSTKILEVVQVANLTEMRSLI